MKNCLLTMATIALFGCVSNRALADTFGSGGNSFDIEFVTVGQPGNPDDTTGVPSQVGAVSYAYRIGKYEISRDQVTKADAEGNLQVTLDGMGFVTGGPRPAMPATGVSWNEAAPFVNWLNITSGFSPAYNFGSQPAETGYSANANILPWKEGDLGFDATNPFRSPLAYYFLPSVDEWYKAAYFDPEAGGGEGGYWDFPTGSDLAPAAVVSGTSAGTAVYSQSFERGPADVTQAGGLSPSGVMGLAGNVWEFTETSYNLPNTNAASVRDVRGGRWSVPASYLSNSFQLNGIAPSLENHALGFRVASHPEPSGGDFNSDGTLDSTDINNLTLRSAEMRHLPAFDLTGDGLVDSADVTAWAHNEFGTWLGDANLDHAFTSDDLITVVAAFTYEQDVVAAWTTGDFNGNGRFDSVDLIDAVADQGYEVGPYPGSGVAAVPEPTSCVLALLGLGALVSVGRGRRRTFSVVVPRLKMQPI